MLQKSHFTFQLTCFSLALAVIATNCSNVEPLKNPTGAQPSCDLLDVTVSELSASNFGLSMQMVVNDITHPDRVFSQSELQAILGSSSDSSSEPTNCSGTNWCGSLTVGSLIANYNLNAGQINVSMPLPNTLQWFTNGNTVIPPPTGVSGYGRFLYYGPSTLPVTSNDPSYPSCVNIQVLQTNNTGVLWMIAPSGYSTGPSGCDIVTLDISPASNQNSINGTTFQMTVTDQTNPQVVFTYTDLQQILNSTGGSSWMAYLNGYPTGISLVTGYASPTKTSNNTIQWFSTFKNTSTASVNAQVVFQSAGEKLSLSGPNSTNRCIYISVPVIPRTFLPITAYRTCTSITLNVTGHFNLRPDNKDHPYSTTGMTVTLSVSGPSGMLLSKNALKKLALMNSSGTGATGTGAMIALANTGCQNIPFTAISLQKEIPIDNIRYPSPNTIQWTNILPSSSGIAIQENNANSCVLTVLNNAPASFTNSYTGTGSSLQNWGDASDPFCVNISGLRGSVSPHSIKCTDISMELSGSFKSETGFNVLMRVDAPTGISVPGLYALALLTGTTGNGEPFIATPNDATACGYYLPFFPLQGSGVFASATGITATSYTPNLVSWDFSLSGFQAYFDNISIGCLFLVSNASESTIFTNSITGGTGKWGGEEDPFCVNITSFTGIIVPIYKETERCLNAELYVTGHVFPNSQGVYLSMSVSGLPSGVNLSATALMNLAGFENISGINLPQNTSEYILQAVPTGGCSNHNSFPLANFTTPLSVQTSGQTISWIQLINPNNAVTGAGCIIHVNGAGLKDYTGGITGTGPTGSYFSNTGILPAVSEYWAAKSDPYCIRIKTPYYPYTVTGTISSATSLCDDILVSISGTMNPAGTQTNVIATVTDLSNPIAPLSYQAIQKLLNLNSFSLPGFTGSTPPPTDAVQIADCNINQLGNYLINGTGSLVGQSFFPIVQNISLFSFLTEAKSFYLGNAAFSWTSTLPAGSHLGNGGNTGCKIYASGAISATAGWGTFIDPICVNVTYTGTIGAPTVF